MDVLRALLLEGGTILPAEYGQNGELETDELLALVFLVKRLRPRHVFEFGTFRGTTALTIAANAPSGATVWTLDTVSLPKRCIGHNEEYHPDRTTVGKAFLDRSLYRGRAVMQLWGDSLETDLTQFYGLMDLVLVDGGHDPETVRHDVLEAWRLLRDPGGASTLLVHDCTRVAAVLMAVQDVILLKAARDLMSLTTKATVVRELAIIGEAAARVFCDY